MDDLISRQATIDAAHKNYDTILDFKSDGRTVAGSFEDIINALPSAQPENADCIYCHEDSDGYVKPIEKNGHAFICFGMNGWELSLKANGWHGSAKIQYCPMCGRRLSHE